MLTYKLKWEKMSEEIYYQGSRPEVLSLIKHKPQRVLEIGCGDGSFQKLLNSNVEYWGIEPFPEAAEEARSNIHTVIESSYEESLSELPENYFDLIICNDVVEHLVDHDFFFNSIKSKISKDGYIVGSIPNVRYLDNIIGLMWRKDWAYQNDGILDRTHLRFFTEKSLKEVFSKHGYKQESFKYLNTIETRLHPPKYLFFNILILLLGQDTRPLQFGFRIKPK